MNRLHLTIATCITEKCFIWPCVSSLLPTFSSLCKIVFSTSSYRYFYCKAALGSSFLRHPQSHFALFTTFTHWPISISAARIQWKHHLFPFPLSTEDRREILNSISPFLPSLRFRTIIIPFPLYCYIRYTPPYFPSPFCATPVRLKTTPSSLPL